MKSYHERKVLCAALALLLATPAAAKPRSLNYRMRKKPAVSTGTVDGVEPSSGTVRSFDTPAPSTAPVRLMGGRWSPEARAAIEKLIAERGRTSTGYDIKAPPVAVLPWSDAAVAGDPAELVFLRLVTEAKFKVSDSWWEIVPIVYGRQPTRAAYESFVSLSSSVWTAQPGYHGWRKGMLSSYVDLCRGVGRKECRSYLARLWAGWRADEAEDFAKETLAAEKRRPGSSESIPGEPGDKSPLHARRGLRIIPEMRDLSVKLKASGFDVWVIDDLPQSVLLASAGDYGVDPSRVYGVQNSTDGPRMGAEVLKPVPTRGGKTEIVQAALGRPADLVVGRDIADFDVLNYGDGVRVVFDLDPELVKKARERGWPVQKAFAR
jgi:phosphoserine phosphatase